MAGAHVSQKSGAPTLVERLASWTLEARDGDIPQAALRQAKLLVLDTLGCGLAAIEEETSRAATDLVRSIGGAPQCAVIGMRERTNFPNATLANGVLIRTLDLNDYIVEPGGGIGGHPSDNIPVALAAAEFCGRSGRETLTAIVLAYEAYDRMKTAMGTRTAWDGVSVSGAVAPMVAGRLMGLDSRRLAHAIALGLSQAAVSAVVRAGDISAAKSIANARVAQHGVVSALLARHGVTGPLTILDHPRGMKSVFPQIDGPRALDAPMPEASYIMHANVKAFPCLATGQAAVAAAIKMHAALGGDLSGVERVRVIMADHPSIVTQQNDPSRVDPQSREAADHSFEFLTAVALVDGRFGLEQFADERWNAPDVRQLMARMEMTTSADLAARAPKRCFPCALELEKNGRKTAVEILAPPGFSNNGLDERAVIKKFDELASDRLGTAERQRLIDGVMTMEAAKDCGRVLDAIRLAG